MKQDPRTTTRRRFPAAQEDKVAPSQQNWFKKLRKDKNASSRVRYEHSLYSDAHVTGEYRTTQGPYTFLNTIPMPTFDGAVKVPIVLRSEMYIEFSIPDMTKTDESVYHGGDLVDEIVALASLSLGIRLLNGGTSREFGTDGDPYGRPREWAGIPAPVFRFRRNMPILPAVGGSHSMEALRRLETIPRIEPPRYVSLVRACKAYQEALWICESEPNLAWLLFVSALETAANDVYRAAGPSSERLRIAKPELAEHLEEIGGREHLQRVADQIADTLKSTKKFIDFGMKFTPKVPSPKERPLARDLKLDWRKPNLKKVLRKVYQYRSRALHEGIPFPDPMLGPPFRMNANEPGSEVPLLGEASYSKGGTWVRKDVPVNLSTFHYITRNALLKWWDSDLVKTP